MSETHAQDELYVPGEFRCAKCGFTLSQFTLSASTGAVGERDEPGEKCPNDGSPLWRVTWKQRALEHYERCTEEMARAQKAETALAALQADPEYLAGASTAEERDIAAAIGIVAAASFDLGLNDPPRMKLIDNAVGVLYRAICDRSFAAPPPEYLSGQEAMKVKPLEWRKEIGNITGSPVWRAASIIGRYTVIGDLWWGPEPTNDWANDAGEEACMAAAEADYQNRILSAIATPDLKAGKAEVTDAMVEAAEAAVYPRHERGFLVKPLIDAIDMRAALAAALNPGAPK